MASEEPKILRPKPQRPFNPHTIAQQQPPSPLLAPIPVDDTPSRTHSVLNLTSSTLLGIYSPTGYDNEREEPSTPWGTGSETPAITSSYYPARRPSFTPSPPEQPLVPFALGLVIRTVLLGSIGMLYGLLVRHLHDEQQLAPFAVEGIIKPRNDWTYFVFWAVAGVAWGTLLPWVDTFYGDGDSDSLSDERSKRSGDLAGEKATRPMSVFSADWTPVIRSVGVFVGIAFAIRRVPWTSTMQASLTLSLVNPVLWYLIDRSQIGFILSTAVGATGTALLLASNPDIMPTPAPHLRNATAQGDLLLNQNYVSRESIEGGVWIMSVLFCSCVCFGSVGRMLALSGPRYRSPAHPTSSRKRNVENGAQ